MKFDTKKFINTISAIFIIVIFSSNIRDIINKKIKEKLLNNIYIKHLILLLSIYTTKTYDIIQYNDDDKPDSFGINIIKTFIIWIMFLLLLKINFIYLVIIIVLSLINHFLQNIEIKKNIKKNIIMVIHYLMLFVYIYGVYEYYSHNLKRSRKNVVKSLLKTIN